MIDCWTTMRKRTDLPEIGFVKIGLNAKIRLNSPEGSRFKPLNGEVVFVGADRISSEENDGYYLVKIETKETSFLKGNEVYTLYSLATCFSVRKSSFCFLEALPSPSKKVSYMFVFIEHILQITHRINPPYLGGSLEL